MYQINTSLVRRYAQKYAEMNMNTEVVITRPNAPTAVDADGEISATTYLTVYTGAARITTVGGPVQYSFGEEPQYFSSSQVSIPLVDSEGEPTLPQVNDLVEVVSHHDALMIGRVFRVMDVQAGGQFESVRTMSVTGAQRWEGWNKDPNIPNEWYV